MKQSSVTAEGDGPSPEAGCDPQQSWLGQAGQPLMALVTSKTEDTSAA